MALQLGVCQSVAGMNVSVGTAMSGSRSPPRALPFSSVRMTSFGPVSISGECGGAIPFSTHWLA